MIPALILGLLCSWKLGAAPAQSSAPYEGPGHIDLTEEQSFATDLFLPQNFNESAINGNSNSLSVSKIGPSSPQAGPLSQQQLRSLLANGIDLSLLEPGGTELYQSKTSLGLRSPAPNKNPSEDLRSLDTAPGEEALPEAHADQTSLQSIEYLGRNEGALRVSALNSQGEKVILWFSRTSQNILLRSALLRKLGYRVPAVKFLKRMKLIFSSSLKRAEFESKFRSQLGVSPQRWIVQGTATELLVRDAVQLPAVDVIANLALGFGFGALNQRERHLNALLLPFSLVDVNESVEHFGWERFRKTSRGFTAPYEFNYAFQPSRSDALWMGRKIAALTRQDWEEVVSEAQYRKDAEKLLLEKIISSRNQLMKILNLKSVPLVMDAELSVGAVVKGRLTGEEDPDSAARILFGSPEFPFNAREVWSFAKSRAVSEALSNLSNEFNLRLQTSTSNEIRKRFEESLNEQIKRFLETGEFQRSAFSVFETPVAGLHLGLGRDVVTGTFLGVGGDFVQMVDSFSYGLEAGVQLGFEGFGPAELVTSGSVKAYFRRQYQHLKPMKNFKESLSEPYRNIILPKFKAALLEILERPLVSAGAGQTFGASSQGLAKWVQDLNRHFKVGESLIFTDSVGLRAPLRGTLPTSPWAAIGAELGAQANFFRRWLITRKEEKKFQVFFDPGNWRELTSRLQFQFQYAPVFILQGGSRWGVVEAQVFQFNVDPANQDATKDLQDLVNILRFFSEESLSDTQKPLVVRHRFNQSSGQASSLIFRALQASSERHFEVASLGSALSLVADKQGLKETLGEYLHLTAGDRWGIDPQGFFFDLVNALINKFAHTNFTFFNPNSGNPGDSLFGKSHTRSLQMEVKLQDSNFQKEGESFASYRWTAKGFRSSPKKLYQNIQDLEALFGAELLPPLALKSFDAIYLYRLDVQLSFYDRALRSLSKINLEDWEQAFREDVKYAPVRHVRNSGPSPWTTYFFERRKIVESLLSKLKQREFQMALWTQSPQQNLKNQQKNPGSQQTLDFQQREGTQRAQVTQSVQVTQKLVAQSRFQVLAALFFDLKPRSIIKLVGGHDRIFVVGKLRGFREGDRSYDQDILTHTLGQPDSERAFGIFPGLMQDLGLTESEFALLWALQVVL